MKKLSKILLGLSLLAGGSLYATGANDHEHKTETSTVAETTDHMGNHMHEGKMTNHMNMDGMTTKQMQDTEMNSYHHNMMINGYSITLSSEKPLTDGKNHMFIKLMQNKKEIKNADISMNLSMPSMPGMEFTEQVKENGSIDINFSMAGEWAYELIFKTSDGVINKVHGSVNIK